MSVLVGMGSTVARASMDLQCPAATRQEFERVLVDDAEMVPQSGGAYRGPDGTVLTTQDYERFCLNESDAGVTLLMVETDGDFVVIGVRFGADRADAERLLEEEVQSNARLRGVKTLAYLTSTYKVVNLTSVGE
ncbi:hypothetical protein [Devosia sp. 1566]|uniref:hypothetical protein n=1 Tax=Devosia sp. 1566 TaxID=2499144 RepID=UPI000FD79E72|nr:hypothetical protein [Devosia sp. 1566]